MQLSTAFKTDQLDEASLKGAIAAGALAASAIMGGSTAGNPSYISHDEHQAEVRRTSFKTFAAKHDVRAKTLASTITDKYSIGSDLALKVAKLALKYEKPTFPKAEDILAVCGIESSFKPHAVSQLKNDPAVGLMQVRPAVWNLDTQKLKGSVEEQIKVGAEILHGYYKKLKTKDAALQAYNVGLTNYMKKKGLNPRYVPKFDNEREMYEGLMKRSDPYISGERNIPTVKKQVTAHTKRLQALGDKANKPLAYVRELWRREVDKVDASHPNRFGIVMLNLKRQLGIA